PRPAGRAPPRRAPGGSGGALDLGHALLLEEIDPLVELDARIPPDVPEMEAEARVADVPVANEKLEGVAERRRADGAEAKHPVGGGPETSAEGEGPPRRGDGVHVPVLSELLTEGDLLAERGDVRGIHAGAFQDRFAERPGGSELLEHELEVRRGHGQVVRGTPETPCHRMTIHQRRIPSHSARATAARGMRYRSVDRPPQCTPRSQIARER